MKMAIIGSDYVATVTGTCMAELGHQVICADTADTHGEARIRKLQQGILPFYESSLEPLLKTNIEEGRLRFTTDIQAAAAESEVIFLCMDTQIASGGKPDMKPLGKAVTLIAQAMNGYKLIVEKSTMPIKTGDWLKEFLQSKLPPDAEFDIAAVPQFMREGQAVHDFMAPDRIVIGAETQRAIDYLVNIYRPLNAPLLITDISSAELIKHATNAFLAMKISFINSIAQICEKTGADITNVSIGIGMDKRIGPDFLNAGIGYGGVFFPKDIQSLLNIAHEYHINLDILKTTEVINRYQRISFIERIEETLKEEALREEALVKDTGKAKEKTRGKTIAVWGLAYRPNTDDMRDAPSVHIIRGLQQRGAHIRAYDPLSMEKTREMLPDITYCQDPYDAATGADAIAIITSWDEFTYINFQRLKDISHCRIIVDGRNLYNPQRMGRLGYHYISVGRKEALPPEMEKEKPKPLPAHSGKKKSKTLEMV